MVTNVSHSRVHNTATVLVVDDELAVLSAVRRVLVRAGYNVLSTSEPQRALDMLDATHVDVLIADLLMPEMSGAELGSTARERHPEVVRIILTGCSAVRETEKLINDGEIHRFLTKPFEPSDLRSTIALLLDRREELHRSTVAGRSSLRRSRMLADLEREHPGITKVQRNTEGVYVLERSRLMQLEERLESSFLREMGRLIS